MLTKLKKTAQSWMAAEARVLHRLGLRPNQVSAAGIILGAASGLAYRNAGAFLEASADPYLYRVYLSSAVLLLLASGLCDALDGALARLHREASTLGGFLDSLLDRYVDSFVYIGLILGGLCDVLWGLLALVGSLLTSYTRARSEAAGVPMETVGVLERAERLLIIAVASLLSLAWPATLRWGVILLALGTNFTVVQRVVYFRRKSSSRQRNKTD